METQTRGRAAGLAAVVVSLGGVLLATVLSPGFTWTDHALSELGVTGTAPGTSTTMAVFNGGLILGGVIGLVFSWYLYKTAEDDLTRVTGSLFGVTAALMGGVGVFPMDVSLHGSVAVGFFLFISMTLAVAGIAGLRRGNRQYGAISLLLAVGNVGVWSAWGLAGGPDVIGLALPESGGSILISGWVVLTALHYPTRP